MGWKISLAITMIFFGAQTVQAHGEEPVPFYTDAPQDDGESFMDQIGALGCVEATAAQIAVIDAGNKRKADFLQYCDERTDESPWCQQLVRPNPASKSFFRCTYGASQVHQLIHPDPNTWDFAVRAVLLVKELQKKGLRTCEIYNWWRPEPYNDNVGGAPGRHPFGTSVDVRLCSDGEAIKAFNELCKYRAQGKIRAIGYYGGASLHFGIGDKVANTWGKSCP